MSEDPDEEQGAAQSDDAVPEAEVATDPLAVLEQERDALKALAQRTQADFVNYKRRTDQERLLLARNASNQLVTRLLPIVDDLQRAVDALPEEAPGYWGDGVRMILQNLHARVEAEGVSVYEPEPGETPNWRYGLSSQGGSDAESDRIAGTIIESVADRYDVDWSHG